jgi:N-acetylneuraminic acid mutarotase
VCFKKYLPVIFLKAITEQPRIKFHNTSIKLKKIKSTLMRKNRLLFVCMSVLAMASIFFTSCNKSSSSSDDDIIGNWKRSSEFEGVGRTEAVTFTIGTRVFVGLGYDGTDRLKDLWEFDQSTGTWYRRADFPGTARSSAVAFAVNGKGYVGTGYDGLKKLKDFWEYDPTANTWKQVADFGGTERYGAVAFSIGSMGYVSTGYDGNYLKDLWQYDPVSDEWIQKASLAGSKRMDAVAFVNNNKAYIVTGINNGSYLADFWVYDPVANSWAEKRKITSVSDDSYDDDYGSNITRSNATVFVMNDKAYLTTGSTSGVIGTTWEYNIANDTWAQKTSFEGTAREGALSFTVNSRGFLTTGHNSSTRFDDLWEFFPNSDQDDDDN